MKTLSLIAAPCRLKSARKLAFAALVLAGLAASSNARAEDEDPLEDPGYENAVGFMQHTTTEGCLYWYPISYTVYSWTSARKAYPLASTFTPGCTSGRLISGKGKLSFVIGSEDLDPSASGRIVETDEGNFVDGYLDGRVEYVIGGKPDSAIAHMGCEEGDEAECGPGTPNAYQPESAIASEPTPAPNTASEPAQPAATKAGVPNIQVDTVLALGNTCIAARALGSTVSEGGAVTTEVEIKNNCATDQVVAAWLATADGMNGVETFPGANGPAYVDWRWPMPKLDFRPGDPIRSSFTMSPGSVGTTSMIFQPIETARNLIFKSAACDFLDAKGREQWMFRDVTLDGFTQAICMPHP